MRRTAFAANSFTAPIAAASARRQFQMATTILACFGLSLGCLLLAR